MLPRAGRVGIVEKGFIFGALVVGLLSWGPFDASMPLFTSIQTMYSEVIRSAGALIFPGW